MIKFGPSGNSESFYNAGYKNTEQAAEYVKNLGLDLFEYSFGRGVLMSEQKAVSISNAFDAAEIELSVHAPYFINFSGEEENIGKSYGYIVSSAKAATLMNAKRVIFHPASQGKMHREQAVSLCLDRLKILRDIIYESGLEDIIYCPETMGKQRQIGTIEEVVAMCKIDGIYLPCIDFGHINARELGSLKTTLDYKLRLEYLIGELGYDRVKNFHIHFSKIEYGPKGELRHLTFSDEKFGPDYEPLLIALEDLSLKPHIICESSGTQAEDALKMKEFLSRN